MGAHSPTDAETAAALREQYLRMAPAWRRLGLLAKRLADIGMACPFARLALLLTPGVLLASTGRPR